MLFHILKERDSFTTWTVICAKCGKSPDASRSAILLSNTHAAFSDKLLSKGQ